MRSIIKYMCVIGLSLFIATTAIAQESTLEQFCTMTHQEMVDMAQSQGEHLKYAGINGLGNLFQIFMNDTNPDKEGKWTLIITRPNGASCVMDFGDQWYNAMGQPS